mmetsp:Transcript_23723/g.63592  ORF Transcript_23723/g.63592 Transcript_23723/m.63592 type:complete len:340 (-) Transcript_23723:882-1901(-)
MPSRSTRRAVLDADPTTAFHRQSMAERRSLGSVWGCSSGSSTATPPCSPKVAVNSGASGASPAQRRERARMASCIAAAESPEGTLSAHVVSVVKREKGVMEPRRAPPPMATDETMLRICWTAPALPIACCSGGETGRASTSTWSAPSRKPVSALIVKYERSVGARRPSGASSSGQTTERLESSAIARDRSSSSCAGCQMVVPASAGSSSSTIACGKPASASSSKAISGSGAETAPASMTCRKCRASCSSSKLTRVGTMTLAPLAPSPQTSCSAAPKKPPWTRASRIAGPPCASSVPSTTTSLRNSLSASHVFACIVRSCSLASVATVSAFAMRPHVASS